MPSHPPEFDFMFFAQQEQALPEVWIESFVLGVAHPRMGFPFQSPPVGHCFDQVLRVAEQGHTAGLRQGLEPCDCGGYLHPVVGGQPETAGFFFSCPGNLEQDAVTSRTGVTQAGPVCVYIDRVVFGHVPCLS